MNVPTLLVQGLEGKLSQPEYGTNWNKDFSSKVNLLLFFLFSVIHLTSNTTKTKNYKLLLKLLFSNNKTGASATTASARDIDFTFPFLNSQRAMPSAQVPACNAGLHTSILMSTSQPSLHA